MNIAGIVPNLIAFTRTPERMKRAVSELNRVGFYDIEINWSFPNPFDRALLNTFPHTKMMDENIGFFNCSRMHYRIIKREYELGRPYVMICEDDCRFRKSVKSVVKEVESAPDSDVLLLDGIPPKKGVKTPLVEIKEGWSTFESMRSGACYILSRNGMARILWLYESVLDKGVGYRKARICDQWFERKMLKGYGLCMATPNLAVQQTTDGNHNSGNEWRLAGYKTLGIDLTNYEEY